MATGGPCTGKSTLVQALKCQFDVMVVDEYARDYLALRPDKPLAYGDVLPIAKGQLAAEKFGRDQATKYLVLDTNLLNTKIYSQYYYQQYPDVLDQWLGQAHYDHYIVCDNDIPWVADYPQRQSVEERQVVQSMIESELKLSKVSYQLVKGDLNQRLAQIADWFNQFE